MSRHDTVREHRASIPAQAGIGLRAPHHHVLLTNRPSIAWLEVHSENFFGTGGQPLTELLAVRDHYPVSLHGVGLSIGSADPLNKAHLRKLKHLIDVIEPGLVSEHLAWSLIDGRYLNDLLPLPYTEESLTHVIARVDQAQEYLGHRILLENISSYLEFEASALSESEFLVEVARRSGCALLLDINNVYVAACNHGFDPLVYLQAIPAELVAEIHLAGYTVKTFDDGQIHIDTHIRPVAAEVWALYGGVIGRYGPKPTLIEWDTDLPELNVLLNEAAKAERFLEVNHALAA
jgi:uncharacterized protein